MTKVAEALLELGRSKSEKLEGLNPDTIFSKENIFWAFSILFSRCVRLEGNAASTVLFPRRRGLGYVYIQILQES